MLQEDFVLNDSHREVIESQVSETNILLSLQFRFSLHLLITNPIYYILLIFFLNFYLCKVERKTF